MTDKTPAWQVWERRRDVVRKPRVSWCNVTRKWIVNGSGNRHRCQPYSMKAEVAFRRWEDAMDEAVTIYREQARKSLGL